MIVGGEHLTLKGGSPNPAGLWKSVYAEHLALQYKIPLIRLHEGGGGAVGGTSQNKNHRPLEIRYSVSRDFNLWHKLLE